ncbi:MAG: FAD-dependent oxidoreductase [bacterium]
MKYRINSDLDEASAGAEVLIVGGGIIGAAVFRELCLDGLNAVLVEKDDFCGGVSAGSTEMAHGGFRYLLTLSDWSLVRESLAEREILHRIAPHLVRRLNFYMPLYRGDGMYFDPSPGWMNLPEARWKIGGARGFGTAMVAAGMSLYRLLAAGEAKRSKAGASRDDLAWRKMPPGEALGLGLNLNPEGMAACFRYTDSKIEDVERLVVENILSGLEHARERGLACAASNATAFAALDRGAAFVRDEAKEYRFKPKVVVAAAGAEINGVSGLAGRPAEDIHLVSGTHLIAPRKIWSGADPSAAVAWWTGGKVMFCISKGADRLLAGTSERYIPPGEAGLRDLNHREDVEEMLRRVRRVLPGFEFDASRHPYYTRARPLRPERGQLARGESPTRFSRRDYVRATGGVIAVTGKIGPSRRLAERAAEMVFRALGRPKPTSRTAREKLYGGALGDATAEEYAASFAEKTAAGRGDTGPAAGRALACCARRYGSRAPDVVEGASSEELMPIDPECPDSQPLRALLYSFSVEGARSLVHAFKRTGVDRHIGEGVAAAGRAADYLAAKLRWDEAKKRRETELYREFIAVRKRLAPRT